MSTHENVQTFFIQRFTISFTFSRFMTRDNHELHNKIIVKQALKRRLRCLSRDRKSLYQNDIIHSHHEKDKCC